LITKSVAFVVAASTAESQTPQRTSATYEDWTLRCESLAGTPPQKSCEIVQATHLQGQNNPVTQLAIGKPPKAGHPKLVVLVPTNVWIPTGAKLVYDEKQASLAVPFNRCLPEGCFGEVELTDDALKSLRARTSPGRLEFKDASQRDIAAPISFKGFGQAFDALVKD
jgi:invasion protein IalB